jgi:hypothetical protein
MLKAPGQQISLTDPDARSMVTSGRGTGMVGYNVQVAAGLERNPHLMRIRRSAVEHPFGTLKAWMGSTHFRTKTLPRVNTEMSLCVLACNLRRMLNLAGTKQLIGAIRAWPHLFTSLK